jgi:TRAP transporter TAXI family solute receptor
MGGIVMRQLRNFFLFTVVGISTAQISSSAAQTIRNIPSDQNKPVILAQSAPARVTFHEKLSRKVNENTVTVVGGNPNGTFLYLAYDLSAVLDEKGSLRVLPVVGKGAFQNVVDVLHLKGVDLGFTTSNIISSVRETGELGSGIENRIAYITVLYTNEMHILAGKGIDKVEDLNGKPVNFSDIGSGSQFATRQILKLLGITPKEVNMGQGDAYLKVKTGELAATILTAGKPSGSFAKFKLEPGMKLLPVRYAPALEKDFLPGKITHSDYPNLVREGEAVNTVGAGVLLISYNWPKNTERYRRVANFVDAFFSKFQNFRKAPRHPKWRVTNLLAKQPGVQRFPAAEEWLQKWQAENESARTVGLDPSLVRSQAARAEPNTPERQRILFKQFLEYVKRRDASAN